ncbi:transcriptional regulator [Halosolutus amylolyticus]|uniref:Transcriptional regulator n=1 Tax=Halosolutus amylolyticus TaxID=2932267 RepID=A0ABD5PV18_9EURY|nr:transcriptional regulator [Halosolutus amylolyticus]
MDSRTQERVERWDSRPFSGGYDGLSDLAAADFSGAVTAAGTWLFMLNGRIVGVVDGDIEDFESASGTRYDAPHPSLPLLCAMEERGGETRAKYYTNETPLQEVDRTLQDGSFTGYVELSENVLSGDYYAVYYGGRRMAAAYIGNAERLITGDEAFERADDEVGIYEVLTVDVEVTDVPGTGGTDPSDAATDADGAATDAGGTTSTTATETGGTADTGGATDDSSAIDDATSTIESIDVGGLDGSTADAPEDDAATDSSSLMSDIDLTEDPTGITTTEETEPEPTSTGITDADPESTQTSAPGPDTADDHGLDSTVDIPGVDDAADDEADETASGLPIDEAEADIDDADPEPGIADDGRDRHGDVRDRNAVENATSTAPEVESEQAETTESATATGSEADASAGIESASTETDDSASSPDLAEVEAAAEELDRNDISWVADESDESPADDDAAGATSEPATEEADLEERFQEEEQWREARSIPSIDPDNSETPASPRSEAQSAGGPDGSQQASAGGSGPDRRAGSEQTATAESRGRSEQPSAGGDATGRTQEADRTRSEAQERIAALTERLEQYEEQRDALRAKAEELQTERDRLRSKNQELVSTVERLQSRIDELETELDRARDAAATAETAGTGVDARTELQPQRALSETNLFVRYASKSQPTLERAHGGEANRDEVAGNLRLEHHTGFDAADVAVAGQPYEEFLASTMEYRFVDWLTEMVLFEIRDTGHADGLGDLYDAIPRIDRAELHASISLEDDDTEEVPDQVTFDVVAYDKMGNPLVVANLNDSRSPATEGMLAEMEEAASAVKANYPDLAAAIVVTSSYFEPGALEVTEQATSSGFLTRGSKLSYVNLSRKAGYHLCLVESRSEGFHMNVPEL